MTIRILHSLSSILHKSKESSNQLRFLFPMVEQPSQQKQYILHPYQNQNKEAILNFFTWYSEYKHIYKSLGLIIPNLKAEKSQNKRLIYI